MFGCAIAVVTLSWAVGHATLDTTPITDDEWAYLFHARAIALGGLTAPAHPASGYFDNTFLIHRDGHWYSQYPLGHPLALSLGVIGGDPWLVNPILAGLFVVGASLVARELAGRLAASAAAMACLSSPFLVAVSGTLLAHTPTATLLAGFLWTGLRASRTGTSIHWAWVSAAAFGAAVITRPSSAVFVGLPLLVMLGFRSGRLPDRIQRWTVFLATGCVMAGVLLTLNTVVNGHPLRSGYVVYWLPREGLRSPFGFGTYPWGIAHTPATAWGNTWHNAVRLNAWALGWPASLAVVLVAAWHTRQRQLRWLSAAGWFPFVPLAFFFWPGISDVGPVLFTETLVAWMPLAGVVAARRWPRLGATGVAVILAGLLVVPMTFHRLEAPRLSAVADHAREPQEVVTSALAPEERAVVFCDLVLRPGNQRSWVASRPNPWPDLRDRVVYVLTAHPIVDRAFWQQYFPDRTPYRLLYVPEHGFRLEQLGPH